MKRFLLFVIFYFSFINIYSQLDTQHWFAPMYDGQSNGGSFQYLYLSTNETTPFTVNVYNNNILIYKTTISKGSPGSIKITNRDYIITKDTKALHKVGTMGLYATGDHPFFASLRFGMQNHAEIITSKGNAGIGTKFFIVTVPNSYTGTNVIGFGASFLATQDKTTVTVNNFKKPLIFNDYGSATSFTFTLDKGQSYIIDGRSINADNADGFIGATVTADKPISMSNGSFNGQFSTIANSSSGTDIYMDQSVPTDKLGDEFVIVKGYGDIGNPSANIPGNKMEGAIIVSTENNTQIYLNDSTTPIATLINAGDYYPVDETNYVNRGNSHYNLHIKTSNNVYVYQMMGGVETNAGGGTPLATGGMNYIPPLNCYLPRKIDEIGSINVIGDNTYITKLNIITEKGASVKVNGITPNTLYGPYDTSAITTNQKWVSYSIPNQTGNITVESDKAVTAGLSGGDISAGYGGYFAGFSSIPLIEGDDKEICLPNITLKLTSGFDHYKWMVRNADGTIETVKDVAGNVPDANILMPTKPGYYWATVQQGSCPAVTTKETKILNCTTHTLFSTETCESFPITPKLTLDNVATDGSTIQITKQPSLGDIEAHLGDTPPYFIYKAKAGQFGDDTFTYTFCGTGALSLCEEVVVKVKITAINSKDAIVKGCAKNNVGSFDLTSADVTSDTNITKRKYYPSLAQAESETGEITANLDKYASSDNSTVYVKLFNDKTCSSIQKITLKFYEQIIIDTTKYNATLCDDDLDGSASVNDFSAITAAILENYSYFNGKVTYYLPSNPSQPLNNGWSFSTPTAVIVKVDSPDGCPSETGTLNFKIGTKVSLSIPSAVDICDNDLNGTEPINLSNYLSFFVSDPSKVNVKYYKSMPDAEANGTSENISQTISGDIIFYYRFTQAGYCDNIGKIEFKLRKSTPSTDLQPEYKVCDDGVSTASVNVGLGYSDIEWNDGDKSQTRNLPPGTYTVNLTNSWGCIYTQTVVINKYPYLKPNITAFNGKICDENMDGQNEITFSKDITPAILPALPAGMIINYYDSSAPTVKLPDFWTYKTAKTINIEIISPYCPAVYATLNLDFGDKITLLTDKNTVPECDDNLDGIKTVNLTAYKSLFIQNNSVNAAYFYTKADAQDNKNQISDPSNVEIKNSQTFFIRFYKAGECSNIGEITVNVKIPKTSQILKDQNICPDSVTILDAGAGFDYYKWTDENGNLIKQGTYADNAYEISNVKIGNYFVELTYDGCTYKQSVSVKSVDLPVITFIEIRGTTITVSVTGGNAPYQYSLDGIHYQDSNIFTNVPYGQNTVYVVSADHCDPVTQIFTIIRLLNVITPNGDGYNDALNYSDLLYKEQVVLKVFNRNGTIVFEGDKSNNFTWDGKIGGRPVNSGSYWFVLQWRDPGSSTTTQHSGWVLVKNRADDK